MAERAVALAGRAVLDKDRCHLFRGACLHARGQVRTGDIRTSRSIIGGTSTAEMLGETTVGGRPAVLPRITGQGYVFGRQQLRLDDNDPFAQGFAMSDTWGPQVGEL
ncbi:proline racemase family protein [Paracoccus yeei]|uniref:proline racemase family protein n=1 Tax=Paracoccus yeei TaxID=147645 RepID=UPI003BF80CEF